MATPAPTPWSMGDSGTVTDANGRPLFMFYDLKTADNSGDYLTTAVNCHDELVAMLKLFDKTVAYYIGLDKSARDDEGDGIKMITLNLIRELLAKATA